MKIYISGPMTGIKDSNFPAFIEAEKIIKRKGHTPVSPHRAPELDTWADYMRYDIKMMLDCEAVCLLEGWHDSVGALLESKIAISLDMKMYTLNEVINEL